MNIEAKALAITKSVCCEVLDPEKTIGYNDHAALMSLAKACALLTSTSKDEREQGKTMVRRWKNSNVE